MFSCFLFAGGECQEGQENRKIKNCELGVGAVFGKKKISQWKMDCLLQIQSTGRNSFRVVLQFRMICSVTRSMFYKRHRIRDIVQIHNRVKYTWRLS